MKRVTFYCMTAVLCCCLGVACVRSLDFLSTPAAALHDFGQDAIAAQPGAPEPVLILPSSEGAPVVIRSLRTVEWPTTGTLAIEVENTTKKQVSFINYSIFADGAPREISNALMLHPLESGKREVIYIWGMAYRQESIGAAGIELMRVDSQTVAVGGSNVTAEILSL